MENAMEENGSPEEFPEIPDASEVYDFAKAQGFMLHVLEEAQAFGLNLLELRDAAKWIAATTSEVIAENYDALQKAGLLSLAVDPAADAEVPDGVADDGFPEGVGREGDSDDESDEPSENVDGGEEA